MNRITDFSYLKNLTLNDKEKFLFFTGRFKESVAREIETLDEVYKKGSLDVLREKVHSLKAMYHSVGALKVEELIYSIEQHTHSKVFHQLIAMEINQLKLLTDQIFIEIEIEIGNK